MYATAQSSQKSHFLPETLHSQGADEESQGEIINLQLSNNVGVMVGKRSSGETRYEESPENADKFDMTLKQISVEDEQEKYRKALEFTLTD